MIDYNDNDTDLWNYVTKTTKKIDSNNNLKHNKNIPTRRKKGVLLTHEIKPQNIHHTYNKKPTFTPIHVAEGNNTGSSNGPGTFDFTANGFKGLRKAAESMTNTSGDTYMYLAIAESPFKTSNAR